MSDRLEYTPAEVVSRLASSDSLDRYFELLMAENAKVNLVSRETERTDLVRLAAESILPLTVLPDTFSAYLDIGSGGGFPSVPLLLSGRIAGPAVLFERTGKKASALTSLITGLNLPARVESVNFEDRTLTERLDLITLRYVKLTPHLLDRITRYLAADGRFVYYSTPAFHVKRQKHRVWTTRSLQDQVDKSFTVFTL